MKRIILFFIALFLSLISFAQITTDPALPKATDEVVITFDASGSDLAGYTGEVYAHTGVTIEGEGRWQYVIESWGNNATQPELTRIDDDLYELLITPSVIEFYDVPDGEKITEICIVFRSASSPYDQTVDLFIPIYESGLAVSISSPTEQPFFIDGSTNFDIQINASESVSTSITIDEVTIHTETISPNDFTYTIPAEASGTHEIIVEATDGSSTVSDNFIYVARSTGLVEALPEGVEDGINFTGEQEITFVLHAPYKSSVYLFGSFNSWQPIAMSKTSDIADDPDLRYWVSVDGLTPGEEYVYQFIIDEELKIADPYTEKTLDPWNDKYISSTTYPNLIEYPVDILSGIASVVEIETDEYVWEATGFTPPAKDELIIYELHIRDFVDDDYIVSVLEKLDYLETLGVNAIELMPINEFEGNDSWGYNPSFYFATDKAYGTKNNYKKFIDECHKRGIAVIIDMVLNHSYGQSPLVQMYFDSNAGEWGQPSPENPWYNEVSPNTAYSWGNDFNHESEYTKDFVDRVNRFWLEEFKVDGFRFDFTKGFTNTPGDGSAYDIYRINILKRMASEIWNVNPNAYVILEHFTANNEEKELAEYRNDEGLGMLIWGNVTHAYNEASMGWLANSNFSSVSYKYRGWNVPHLVGYMESHDEERMMYKNITYGNSSNPNHNVKELDVALQRQKLAGAFFFTIPGPKMIWQFGELGYDISIDYNGRTGRKPVKWDYFGVWGRRNLYNAWAELISLRKAYPTFTTNNYTTSLTGAGKTITLLHDEIDAVIVGNFDVTGQNILVTFPSTGVWYEYFSQTESNFESTSQTITLGPGEYRMFTSEFIERDDFILGTNNETLPKRFDTKIWPNPATDRINIAIYSEKIESAEIILYDINGRALASVFKGNLTPGQNTIEWINTQNIKSGIYIVSISTGSYKDVKKIVIH